jgi:hypothetical protein
MPINNFLLPIAKKCIVFCFFTYGHPRLKEHGCGVLIRLHSISGTILFLFSYDFCLYNNCECGVRFLFVSPYVCGWLESVVRSCVFLIATNGVVRINCCRANAFVLLVYAMSNDIVLLLYCTRCVVSAGIFV